MVLCPLINGNESMYMARWQLSEGGNTMSYKSLTPFCWALFCCGYIRRTSWIPADCTLIFLLSILRFYQCQQNLPKRYGWIGHMESQGAHNIFHSIFFMLKICFLTTRREARWFRRHPRESMPAMGVWQWPIKTIWPTEFRDHNLW